MRILNLMPDDKFCEGFIRKFEKYAPGLSEYYICSRASVEECKYVKDASLITGFISEGSQEEKRLLDQLYDHKFDAVIVHTLPSAHGWSFVSQVVCSGVLSFLMFWGWEVYDLVGKRLLKLRTLYHYFKSDSYRCSFGYIKSRIKYRLLTNGFFPHKTFRTILSADYICPVLKSDYDMTRAKFCKWLKAEYCELNYGLGYSQEENNRPFPEKNCNVIVNNSEDWTGNHFDVMIWLKKLGFSGKVITPISYGRKVNQIAISSYGQKLFGDDYVPILDFVPLEKYNELIQCPSYMVMGHLRQQALGNVITGILSGSKVFFYKKNPVFRYFQSRGVKVFSIEETTCLRDFLSPLSDNEKCENRRLCIEMFSIESLKKQVEHVLSLISNQSKFTHGVDC